MIKLLALLALLSTAAQAGLPPTTSKGSADSSNKVTFNYLFPGHSVSHSGPTATILPATPIAPNFIGQTTAWAPTNPDDRNLEGSVGNWLAFANTVAGSLPDNGMTGGSPSVTCTRSTTNPLDGAASLLVTKGASNRQGDGCSVVFNVQPAYQGSTATITASLNISSGSIVQGDVKLFIYDVTNSLLITPYNNDVIAGPTLTATFPLSARAATPANQQYRLGIYFASTSATAVTLQLDDFAVSPGQAAYGVAGGNVATYTPTVASLGAGSGTALGYYQRDKDGVGFEIDFTKDGSSGSGASVVTFTLPASLTADSTKSALSFVGTCSLEGNFTPDIAFVTSNTIACRNGSGGNITGTTLTSGTILRIRGWIPISGYDANVSMASSSTYKISSYLANGTRVTGGAPTALGQYRSYIRGAASATWSETNGSPTTAPTVSDGVKIWTASALAGADTSNQPSKYDVFVGKNKTVKLQAFSTTGESGQVNVSPISTGASGAVAAYGLAFLYDPSTGVATVVQNIQGPGSTINLFPGQDTSFGNVSSPIYFDITVSENALAVGVQAPRSSVTANTGNGYGSTNTKIRRFTNSTTTGTAITYADSATLGATFTLNEDGVYSVSSSDASTAGAFPMGISLNTTTPTTGIDSIAVAQRVISLSTAGANFFGSASGTIIGHAGDVIRAHTDGSAGSTSAQVQFIVTKVSN